MRLSSLSRLYTRLTAVAGRYLRQSPLFLRFSSRRALLPGNLGSFRVLFVFENRCGFDNIMKQRPQQMALALPDDVLVLYHSDFPEYSNSAFPSKRIKDNLWVLNLDYCRALLLQNTADLPPVRVVWSLSTTYLSETLLKAYKKADYIQLFDYIDALDHRLMPPRDLRLLSSQLSRVWADPDVLIMTTADALYRDALKHADKERVRLICNGVVPSDFACVWKEEAEPFAEMPDILAKNKPVLAYYGALASWLDYEILSAISRSGKYSLVLIGRTYGDTFLTKQVDSWPDTYVLGEKKYEDLPRYLRHVDVCLLPFVLNEITLATSPVKIFEYMAAKKPIVSTPLPECLKYDNIYFAASAGAFLEQLELALSDLSCGSRLEQAYKNALDNSWEQKSQEMLSLVEGINV